MTRESIGLIIFSCMLNCFGKEAIFTSVGLLGSELRVGSGDGNLVYLELYMALPYLSLLLLSILLALLLFLALLGIAEGVCLFL